MIESVIGKSCSQRGQLLLTLDPCQYLVCGGIWVQTRPVCTSIPQHCTAIRVEGFCCPIIRCSDEFSISDIPSVPKVIHTPVSDSGPGQLISSLHDVAPLQIKDGDACIEQNRLESLDPCQTLLCVNKTVLSYIQPCPPALQGCNLIRDPRSCCPINLKCVSNESIPAQLVAMNRQNSNGQNPLIVNREDLSSFHLPPPSNGPSSFRPHKFEISPFGMAIIPTGDARFPNGPSFDNNQFNRQPDNSASEQSRNRPDNSIRNFQENQVNNPQMPQLNDFMNRPSNDRQGNPNIQDHRQTPFIGDQQRFPINRPHNEVNGVPGLISQTGFKPILGGIPSLPMSPPPENPWDKAIQMIEPGPLIKPENTQNHSSELKPTVKPHDIETTERDNKTTSSNRDLINNTNGSTSITQLATSSPDIPTRSTNVPRSTNIPTTKRPLRVIQKPTTQASTSDKKITENPSILIPTFPSSTGGRGCRIGSTKFDDGSTVDVGNPCISCSCMDSGLWCVPNAKCAKS